MMNYVSDKPVTNTTVATIIILDYRSYRQTFDFVIRVLDNFCGYEKLQICVIDNSVNDNFLKLKEKIEESDRFGTPNDIEIFEHSEEAFESNVIGLSASIICCKSYENGGYAKGNNLGFNVAKVVWGQLGIVVFSNNDIYFKEPIDISSVKEIFLENPNIGIIGPKIIGRAGEFQSPYSRKSLWERWLKIELLWPLNKVFPFIQFNDVDIIKHAHTGEVYRIMGSFFFVREDAFISAKGFDEGTFLYGEEMILSERLQRIGFKTYYVDSLEVVHLHGVTISKHNDEYKKLRMRFNSEMYYYENYRGYSKATIFITQKLFTSYIWRLKLRDNISRLIHKK